ncbi:MAG: type II secretion system GspH family protein [Azonexus sp.]|jgi:prepilin-type N-terminal cleavage/methylation domain-containing protein|nr:type II secretion system GspH family protein [Azonexus sp.]
MVNTKESGFTSLELVVVMLIVGILAVIALPRLAGADNDDIVFRDQVVSALRYAQKTAVSHRRMVCVAFSQGSLALRIAAASNSADCDNGADLTVPGGGGNAVTSRSASVMFVSPPAKAWFTSEGWWKNGPAYANMALRAIKIMGRNGLVADIIVEFDTGYVN